MSHERALYIASSNPGKLRDFAMAADQASAFARDAQPWQIEPLPGLATITPPPEDAPTFAGNAAAKASYYSRYAPGRMVVADDSGLEVDALDGAPGVFSARYAERAGLLPLSPEETTDARNNRHLLAELTHVLTPRDLLASLDHRTARYRCALAAASDGRILATSDAIVEGVILLAPRGTAGFGYDPLFLLPTLAQTMAEVDPATRLELSHRGRALRALLPMLIQIETS